MKNKIIARNLTARAEYDVPGNSPATRLESGVGNCYPGLEYDHRNFDRRFFPGLVFEYVSQDDAQTPQLTRRGARLALVDSADTALQAPPPEFADVARALRQALSDNGEALGASSAQWFLDEIEQAGTSVILRGDDGTPLDGLVVWRLVRSLRIGKVTLKLKRRDDAAARSISLSGWRRRFTDETTGVIDASFVPGELTQSLCSPWMHDFRDCGCTYWASNHPDIVFPEIPLDQGLLPAGSSDQPLQTDVRVDWLRSDRELGATPAVGRRAARSAQMSHFEINQRWQDLDIVLEGREIGDFYLPRSRQLDNARPYATPAELRDHLLELAGLEHLVALMYLYARYSVRTPAEITNSQRPFLTEDVDFARHTLLQLAISEMQHLRWVNQILWGLFEAEIVPGWTKFEPALTPSPVIPAAGDVTAPVPAQLLPLTARTLELFVAIEQPSGFIDGRYARATSTLLGSQYPRQLHELASAIVRDGEQHYLHFRDMQTVLSAYSAEYLRPLALAAPDDLAVAPALGTYKKILDELAAGYQRGDVSNMKDLSAARADMFVLDEQLETLAASGKGVPLLSLFPAAPVSPP